MLRKKKTTIVGIILGMMIVTLLVGCLTGKKKGFPPKVGERQQTADLKMKKRLEKLFKNRYLKNLKRLSKLLWMQI
ncbi:TPA: hypothetical protein ACKRBA_000854 [Streptococcus pyogenes]|uniref:hypothetical protein n=1 Tax=Streptococcus pyogenes TaxID=1314 RepID=UPI0004BE2D7C|nr:hypothetical protein [Streptococcus pyogenes]OWC47014.1 hypothetical protein A8G17_33395 [Escherichia coli]HER4680030.1 hypothetical protein [Streptococcus pyogenes NGAS340]HER4737086.1 hypothetical protein [Streptococcus pyogenes NGAS311]HER4837468.1 hypothetical protein [Streptococcus pyogenes NGAS005]KGE58243.1 hypothetical protein SPYSS1447_1203 [Streptococcus pyogenes SS1447]